MGTRLNERRTQGSSVPKSLGSGESKIVPIKCPDAEKQELVSVLRSDETVSSLTRELWRKLVRSRKKKSEGN